MKWEESFDKLVEKPIEGKIAKATVSLANDVVSETRKFSGQLRASVNYALGEADLSKVIVANYEKNALTNVKASQSARFNRLSKGFKIGDTVVVSNSHDYARIYEYVRGDRMFGLAVQRFKL